MPKPWTLILAVGGGDPNRRVGGLSLALRLALDAQRSGAVALVVEGAAGAASLEQLGDPRLHLTRLEAAPSNQAAVVVPAHALMHRQTFAQLDIERAEAGTRRTLDALAPSADVPYWFDPILVVDAPSAKRAERLLFRSLRKREDGWTSRWLNRYISLSISRFLARTPLHPNQLSVVILAIGLLGAYLATLGTYSMMLLGAFLFQMQSVLDGCDGELSRVTHRGSYLGEWLDTIGDDLTNYSFFAGASLGLYRSSHSPLFLLAGAVVVLSGLLTSGLEYRYLLSIHSGDLLKYPLSQATTNQSGRFGAIAPLFKRDTFVFLTLLAAAANLLAVTLVGFAIAALGILFTVLATERRLLQERKAKQAA